MANVYFALEDGEAIAVFTEIADCHGNLGCYQHMGQHSVGMREYFAKLKEATTEQYKTLYNELIRYGYDELCVVSRKEWLALTRKK